MGNYIIYGGSPLYGEIPIGGAKNGALPILFATLLTEEECTLYHIPDIADIRLGVEILRHMGAKVQWWDRHTLKVCTREATPENVPVHLVERMRASSYLLGACLARFGVAPSLVTGGCDFGNRPLNYHYEVLHAMGAEGEGELIAPLGLHTCTHTFDRVSVGATINALLAASRVEEGVLLYGCATEPHVVDLERFLLCLGVEIEGVGTPTLYVKGRGKLRGTPYVVAPDDIEAGTYLCALAATGGKIALTNVQPTPLTPLINTLVSMGCQILCQRDKIVIERKKPLLPAQVKTAPAPGFPTDLHPPLVAAMCFATGESEMTEEVWEHRFRYTEELAKMGASFHQNKNTITISPTHLTGANMTATDLRGGAALVVAALGAKGRSVVSKWEYLDRGYEDMPRKLRGVGAEII